MTNTVPVAPTVTLAVQRPRAPGPKPALLPVGPALISAAEIVTVVGSSLVYAGAGPMGVAAGALAATVAAASGIGRKGARARRASRSTVSGSRKARMSRMGSTGEASTGRRRGVLGRGRASGRSGGQSRALFGRGKGSGAGTGGGRRGTFGGRRTGTGGRSGSGQSAPRTGRGGRLRGQVSRSRPARVARRIGRTGAGTLGAGWRLSRGTGRGLWRGVKRTGRGVRSGGQWTWTKLRRRPVDSSGDISRRRGRHHGKQRGRHIRTTVRRGRHAEGSRQRPHVPVPKANPASAVRYGPGVAAIPVGGSSMSGFLFHDAAAQMRADAAKYQPGSAMDVLRDMQRMPDALSNVAEAFKIIVQKLQSEMPFDTAVADALSLVYQLERKAAGLCADVPPVIERRHDADLARHRSPRPGEKMWDISADGGTA